jgi:hypothetical protein
MSLPPAPLVSTNTINIMNLSGQIVFSDKGENHQNIKNMTINLEALQNGVYILEIISDEERLVRKLIKI